jgi:hypothetical protein
MKPTNELVQLLSDSKSRFSEIEYKTGITSQTLRNILTHPEHTRSRSVLIALNSFFNLQG